MLAKSNAHEEILPSQYAMADTAFAGQLKDLVLDALAFGIIVSDETGHLVYANIAAHGVLTERSAALQLRQGKVVAAYGTAQAEFQGLIARACDPRSFNGFGEYMRASGRADAPDLAIRVMPTRGSATSSKTPTALLLVRIIETSRNLETEARRLFGLTRAEAKLASALAAGLSLDEAAEANAVRMSTARTHLKHIYQKIGVNRQSQVAAMLCGAQIPVQACYEHGCGTHL